MDFDTKSVNIFTGKPDIERAADIETKKQKIRNGRVTHERQWFSNVALLYGKQYFSVDRRSGSDLENRIVWEFKSLEHKSKTLRVMNYCLPLYRSLLSRMMQHRASISVQPSTQMDRDKSAAKVAVEVLEDHWDIVNHNNPYLNEKICSMPLVLKKLFSYMLTVGHGYLYPYFNPNTSATVQLEKQIQDIPVGEIECEVLHPFEVFVDKVGRYIIRQQILPVEKIKLLYGKSVEPSAVGATDQERQLVTLLGGQDENESYDGCAIVNLMFTSPTEQYPRGRFTVATPKEILLEGDIPRAYKGRMGFIRFDYLDIMLAPFPQGFIDQLADLQQDLNFTLSRIAAYKKWFAGKLKVPLKCKIAKSYDDDIGQVIKYDPAFGEPHFEQAPGAPAYLFEEVGRIMRNMEDIAASHDASLGRTPKGIRSGVAIQELSESDDSQLSPTLVDVEQKLAFYCDTVLNLIQEHYTEPRLLSIVGDDHGPEVQTFMGRDVQGNRRIKIRLGSNLPISVSARQQMLMDLAKGEFISKQDALENLELGDLSRVLDPPDKVLAKTENSNMSRGVYHEPNSYDDHTIHLSEHTGFMKSPEYFKLAEDIRALFEVHVSGHQREIIKEQRIMAGAQAPGNQPQTNPMPMQPGV